MAEFSSRCLFQIFSFLTNYLSGIHGYCIVLHPEGFSACSSVTQHLWGIALDLVLQTHSCNKSRRLEGPREEDLPGLPMMPDCPEMQPGLLGTCRHLP